MVAFTTLFWPEEQARMLQPQWTFPTAVLELERLLNERGACLDADPVASAHWMEQRLILPDDMLTKVDRMSMAASLEVRPPLIGDAVLDFAAQLPFCAKHAGSEGKLVLKAVARRLVPKWVVDRPKQGFALPLAEHGGEVLRDATRFALESESSPLREIFRAEALDRFRVELGEEGEGRDPEDSPFRRVHRRWLLVLLARTLARHGVVSRFRLETVHWTEATRSTAASGRLSPCVESLDSLARSPRRCSSAWPMRSHIADPTIRGRGRAPPIAWDSPIVGFPLLTCPSEGTSPCGMPHRAR